jgi:hypothetical protein
MTLDDGHGEWESGLDILFRPIDAPEPEPGTECAAQDDGDRVDWGDDVPTGQWTLAGLEPGLDGCTELALAVPGGESVVMRWYVCTPPLDLPFATGDVVSIEHVEGWPSVVTVRALDAATQLPAEPVRELIASRGSSAPAIGTLETSFVPSYGCDWTVDDCGTVAMAGVLVVGGPGWPSAQLQAGASAKLDHTGGDRIEIALAHGQDRRVVDTSCAMGPMTLGTDLEIAATRVGAAE